MEALVMVVMIVALQAVADGQLCWLHMSSTLVPNLLSSSRVFSAAPEVVAGKAKASRARYETGFMMGKRLRLLPTSRRHPLVLYMPCTGCQCEHCML